VGESCKFGYKRNMPTRNEILPVIVTIITGALGGWLANSVGLPAGWLMGSALAVTAATFAGLPVIMPGWLRDIIFVLIGMSIGASVAPDSLKLLSSWPVSIAGLAIEMVLIVAVTGWMLTKFFKVDPGTAYLSSFPGHLSFVIAIAESGMGNPRQIVIIQVIRILMLTIAVPIAATVLPIVHFAPAAPTAYLSWWQLVALAAGCVAVGLVFVRLRIPAGFVLGAMAGATAGKLGGLYVEAMPHWLTVIAFVLTGALIGSRFLGVTRSEFLGALKGGVIATIISMAIVTFMSYAVSVAVRMPLGQVWLALSPGALEGMGALGIALGYDTAFIAGHHVIRLMLLSVGIPVVVMLLRRRDAAAIVLQTGSKGE
jgi:membrane AbrB-like protein